VSKNPFRNLHREDPFEVDFEAMFDRVEALEPHPRGFAFQQFLVPLLKREGFRVVFDPRVRKGRQCDLLFYVDEQRFLCEAKWQLQRLGVQEVTDLRVRLEGRPVGVVGCFFSMAPFSMKSLSEPGSHPQYEIIAFDAHDIRAIIHSPGRVRAMVEAKRRHLVESGRRLIGASKAVRSPLPRLPPARCGLCPYEALEPVRTPLVPLGSRHHRSISLRSSSMWNSTWRRSVSNSKCTPTQSTTSPDSLGMSASLSASMGMVPFQSISTNLAGTGSGLRR
jgi:hypothetical protein